MELRHLSLFIFIAAFIFVACSSDDKEITRERKEEVFIGISPIQTHQDVDGDYIPFSWDDIGWIYEDEKLVNYSSKYGVNVKTLTIVEHTANRLESFGSYETEIETETSFDVVEIESGLVKKYTIWRGSSLRHFYSFDYDYSYNADGYLESVKGTTQNVGVDDTEIILTWNSGNLVKVVNTTGTSITTYTYTYDDKDYVPMSDFSIYTPLHVYAPYPLIEFYNKLGKQSKNNITEVSIDNNSLHFYGIVKLTYKTELNETGTIKQINHNGIYYPPLYEENLNPVSFKGMRTIFNYTER